MVESSTRRLMFVLLVTNHQFGFRLHRFALCHFYHRPRLTEMFDNAKLDLIRKRHVFAMRILR